MAPPDVQVAVNALIEDAGKWDGWAMDLARASDVAASLTLTTDNLCALSSLVGIPDLYAEIQALAHARARAGAEVFASVAAALRTAASHYEDSDENAVRRIARR